MPKKCGLHSYLIVKIIIPLPVWVVCSLAEFLAGIDTIMPYESMRF